MIIFYNKKTGRIVGTIDGRVHGDEDLKMWIGSREDNDRLIFEWVKNKKGLFEPNVQDKNLKGVLKQLDESKLSVYDFIVDVNKMILIERNKKI
jgi:hypothetical protein